MITSTPNKQNSQPLKKRKIKCTSDNIDSNSDELTQHSTVTSTPSKKNINTVSLNLLNNADKNYSTDNKLINESQHSNISGPKLEDLYTTPQKSIASQNIGSQESIKKEKLNVAEVFSPSSEEINSTDWFSQKVKTPPDTPTQTTPNKSKKRKCSIDICDQLSDVLTPEFLNNDLNDMEPIDMVHDLDSVMNFEHNRIFCSMENSIENVQNRQLTTDAEVDPLSISNDDKINEATENTVFNDYITEILGELDIGEEEELERERENKVNDKLEELYDLKVNLLHEVPVQHKIEHTAGTKRLTKTERKAFLKHGPLKVGQFTLKEDETIRNNWKQFCKVHKWDSKWVQPFLRMKDGNRFYIRSMDERQKFCQFLANGLPWRSLFSVCHRFRYLYRNHDKRFKRYTTLEDKKILSYLKSIKNMEKAQNQFVELGKMLNRTPQSVRIHHLHLKEKKKEKNKTSLSKVKWTSHRISQFINVFMNETLCESIEELKDAIIPKAVWRRLETKLNIDHNVIKKFWLNQLHMQLFCSEPIYMNDIKIKLIEYVYGKGISDIHEIVWSNVAKYFDGVTSIFLCRIFLYLVQDACQKMGTMYFPDIIEYLYNEKIRCIRNESDDKYLPRLSYSKGKVEIIH